MAWSKTKSWASGLRQLDVTYHPGEDIDVLLPVLPFQDGGSATFAAGYFDVEEIHQGDSLVWEPKFNTGLLVLAVKLRCPHG